MTPFDPKAIEAACDSFTPGVRYELTAFTAGVEYARRHASQAPAPAPGMVPVDVLEAISADRTSKGNP